MQRKEENIMVIFEFTKENQSSAQELKNAYKEALIVDVKSLSGNDIVQVIIPLTTLLATLAPIVIKIIESKTCTIKYNGIEVTNLSAEKALDIIKRIEEMKNQK